MQQKKQFKWVKDPFEMNILEPVDTVKSKAGLPSEMKKV